MMTAFRLDLMQLFAITINNIDYYSDLQLTDDRILSKVFVFISFDIELNTFFMTVVMFN